MFGSRSDSLVRPPTRQSVPNITIKAQRTSTFNDSRNQYTLYHFKITQENRYWFITKRFSQFHAIHRSLKEYEHLLPALPPKLMFGSLKEENIQKRKKKLCEYLQILSGIPEIINTVVFRKFIRLDNESECTILKLDDNIYRRIFNFIHLSDLFQNIAPVCGIWNSLAHYSITWFSTVCMRDIWINDEATTARRMEDLVPFMMRLRQLRHLSIHRFIAFDDTKLKHITDNCHMLKELDFSFSGLKEPKIKLGSLNKLTFAYSPNLSSPIIECPALTILDLRGSSITDSVLQNVVDSCTRIRELHLQECTQLKEPSIMRCPLLEYLNLSYCSAVSRLSVRSNRLTSLNLMFTNINNSGVASILDNLNKALNHTLQDLYLNGCQKITKLSVKSNSLKQIYLSACSNLNDLNIDAPVQLLDIRLTSLTPECIEQIKSLEIPSLYLGEPEPKDENTESNTNGQEDQTKNEELEDNIKENESNENEESNQDISNKSD
eukprot:gb/GECH01014758.1/.p1 GENE.gb/GECH01014758.1/~~gb/GECH01014758.1/.p1  ORF type:complete len:492 (+),score=99.41 gb/GECH01014758.1/:1-1476(+)